MEIPTGTLQTRVQVCIVSSQSRYSANSGSVLSRVSGDTGTLQTRVQVCIVEILCKLGFSIVERYRNSANSGSGVYCE